MSTATLRRDPLAPLILEPCVYRSRHVMRTLESILVGLAPSEHGTAGRLRCFMRIVADLMSHDRPNHRVQVRARKIGGAVHVWAFVRGCSDKECPTVIMPYTALWKSALEKAASYGS